MPSSTPFAPAAGDATGSVSAQDDFERALARCDEYLWDAEDGTTKMQGYNNSKLWDTAFAVQAILAAQAVVPVVPAVSSSAAAGPVLERAHGYLRDNQIEGDVPEAEAHFRHASRGGWPFSTRAHGWPITDCTSEALKCALALEGRYWPAIPRELSGAVLGAVGEANFGEPVLGFLESFRAAGAPGEEGHGYVFLGGELGEEIVGTARRSLWLDCETLKLV